MLKETVPIHAANTEMQTEARETKYILSAKIVEVVFSFMIFLL